MRIQSEYKSSKNRWTTSSSYDFQVPLQRSQRTCFSQTAVLWFEVLPGWSPPLRGLLSAHYDMSLALPDLSQALPGTPRCTQCSLQRSEMFPNLSQSLPHQQNVKLFRCHNSTTQLFRTTTPIFPEAPRRSGTGWMQNNVLLRYSESTSGAPQHDWSSRTEYNNILKSMK
jgi:hypothetical protein